MIALCVAIALVAAVTAVALVREDRPYDRQLDVLWLRQMSHATAAMADTMRRDLVPALAKVGAALHREAERMAARR